MTTNRKDGKPHGSLLKFLPILTRRLTVVHRCPDPVEVVKDPIQDLST